MALIFRDVIASKPAGKADVTHVRQFVSAGLALLTSVVVVAAPFKQADWPPSKRSQIPQSSFTPSRSLSLLADRVLPFNQKNWPLATLRSNSQIARNWERANDLPRQLQQTLPFKSTEWPLAKPRQPAAPENPLLNVVAINTVVVASPPFAYFDWPLPRRTLPTPADYVGDTLISTGLTPFAYFDWPLPSRRLPVLTDYVGDTLISQQDQAQPFASFDWPLPSRRLPVLTDYVGDTLISSGLAPFASFDWPLAQRAKNRPPETLPLNTAINTVVVATAPFAQFDWQLAKKVALPAPDALRAPLLPMAGGPMPFAQSDWPAAKRVRLVVVDSPLPLNVARNAGPTPFAYFDWSLPDHVPTGPPPGTPPVTMPPEPLPPAASGPNYLRRLIQSEAARQKRLADADRGVLQAMFSEGQKIDKAELERQIEEEDDFILRFLGP